MNEHWKEQGREPKGCPEGGRFTDENVRRVYDDDLPPKYKKIKTLTKEEYRMWRAGCETLHRGLHSGKMGSIVRFDAGYLIMAGKKIVITTGEYPFIKTGILSFGTHDEQIEYMLYMKRKGSYDTGMQEKHV